MLTNHNGMKCEAATTADFKRAFRTRKQVCCRRDKNFVLLIMHYQ